MQGSPEQINWESAFDKFFPWLTHISNCWMPVNFYTRRDFDVIHNGFPRPPFDVTELASILTSLQEGGIIRFYKDAAYPESQEDLKPTSQEIETELLKPQSRPVRFGRMLVSLTDHGLEALMREMQKFGLVSQQFAEWTIGEFIPIVLRR